MKYQIEEFKRCNRCKTPMTSIQKYWLCEKCGWKVNKKIIIGNKLI